MRGKTRVHWLSFSARQGCDTILATPPDTPIMPASGVTSPYNRPSLFFGIVPAAMNELLKPAFEFGPFSLDPGKRLLLRNGEAVPLAPKVLETLLALVENRDRVLSKDELLDQVWGGTSVEEGGLTRNVSILRKTLGEKPDDHRFIVTVPGRGYRFVATVNHKTVNEPSPAGLPEWPRAPWTTHRSAGAALAGAGRIGGTRRRKHRLHLSAGGNHRTTPNHLVGSAPPEQSVWRPHAGLLC